MGFFNSLKRSSKQRGTSSKGKGKEEGGDLVGKKTQQQQQPADDVRLSMKKKVAGGKKKPITIEAHLEELYLKEKEIVETGDTLGIMFDKEEYLDLLGKLVGEAESLQNFPPELIPVEDKAVQHVLNVLEPYMEENGGPLIVETHCYTEGRSNLIIKYLGANPDGKYIGLIGSHLDVVPAVAENWERNPFELTIEGDKLHGRGTTDCLGHVAMVTLFFKNLAIKNPTLESNIVAVFIASEEGVDRSKPRAGIDALAADGLLDPLKNGTCLWIDSSDSAPCMGTASALPWHLTAHGKRFHSGLPDQAINPIELVSEALKEIQKRFYEDFPPCDDETRYKFMNPSTMKPTQISCAKGSLNQIPPTATVSGDIRLTPFYDSKDAIAKVEQYVEEMNQTKFSNLDTRGPVSKYQLEKEPKYGKLVLEWAFPKGAEDMTSGIACDIDSPGFVALCDAFKTVRGEANLYSVSGSLPLVYQMKKQGYDLQITGFGKSDAYHAENEYCLLSDMVDACSVLSVFCSKMEAYNKTV